MMIKDNVNVDKTFRRIHKLKEDKKLYDSSANETINNAFKSLLFGNEKEVKDGLDGVKNAFKIWGMDNDKREKHNETFNGCLNQLGFEFDKHTILERTKEALDNQSVRPD